MRDPNPKEKPATLLVRKRLRVRSRQGLHARPAALFVQVANRFKASIRVKKGRDEVDGKSIMGILTLAASRGSTILVTIEGPDARMPCTPWSRLFVMMRFRR